MKANTMHQLYVSEPEDPYDYLDVEFCHWTAIWQCDGQITIPCHGSKHIWTYRCHQRTAAWIRIQARFAFTPDLLLWNSGILLQVGLRFRSRPEHL
jgi:hypothetical protein